MAVLTCGVPYYIVDICCLGVLYYPWQVGKLKYNGSYACNHGCT